MNLNKYDTLLEALNDLKEQGYRHSFKLEDNKMRCLENDKTYGADELVIDHQYRFEGMTNPADSSILFAVSGRNSVKGTIVSAYGPEANPDVLEFMDNVKLNSEVSYKND